MSQQRPDRQRSLERLLCHYRVETELAAKLREAPRADRVKLYARVYDELYSRLPDHPQVMRGTTNETFEARQTMRLIGPLLTSDATLVEIGAGACQLTTLVAARVRSVIAIEVSHEIVPKQPIADNCTVVITDGMTLPFADASVDIVFSNQVLEHLHPEDAEAQAQDIHRMLKPGGIHICSTPNRIGGPHDISGFIDRIARGLHLKEYSRGECRTLFERNGFVDVRFITLVKSRRFGVPVLALLAMERAIDLAPASWLRPLGRLPIVSNALNAYVVARKPVANPLPMVQSAREHVEQSVHRTVQHPGQR